MKKIYLLLLTFSFLFLNQTVNAAVSSVSSVENPGKVIKTEKIDKKKVNAIKSIYKKEMRGMSKADKASFIEEKINSENLNLPRKQWLIIGAVLVLAGIVFYFIPFLWFIGAILQAIGGIILIVWLIMWLLDMA